MTVCINDLNAMQGLYFRKPRHDGHISNYWILLEYKGHQKKFYGCCMDTIDELIYGSIKRIFNFEVSVIDSSSNLKHYQQLKPGDEYDWCVEDFNVNDLSCPDIGHVNFYIARLWKNTIDKENS